MNAVVGATLRLGAGGGSTGVGGGGGGATGCAGRAHVSAERPSRANGC